MSVWERVYMAAYYLVTLAVACAPVFVLLYLLELLGDKISRNTWLYDWAERKIAKVQASFIEREVENGQNASSNA